MKRRVDASVFVVVAVQAQEILKMTTAATTNATPKAKLGRRTKKTLGRSKRKLRLKTDKEFAKAYFEGRSKRAADKKSAYRKKKAGKK